MQFSIEQRINKRQLEHYAPESTRLFDNTKIDMARKLGMEIIKRYPIEEINDVELAYPGDTLLQSRLIVLPPEDLKAIMLILKDSLMSSTFEEIRQILINGTKS